MLQIETTAGSWGRVYVSNRWWQQLLSASSSVSFEVMRNLWNKCSLSCNGETHLHTSWKYDCTNLYFIILRRLGKPLDIFCSIQWHCCRPLNFELSFCKHYYSNHHNVFEVINPNTYGKFCYMFIIYYAISSSTIFSFNILMFPNII